MDISDQATDQEERARAISLANVRAATAAAPAVFTGRCANCDEPIAHGQFCDAQCRDDFDRRKKINEIAGKARSA